MTPQQQIEQQIKAVTDTVGRVVSALTGFLLSLPLLGTAITAVIGVIGGFGLALRSATGEAMALARSLSQMRAANGYSFAQGYGIQRQFGAIGISQSDTTGLFSQAGNSAFGFASRGANPRDLAALAAQYQATASQGVFGRQFANSRLDQQFGGNVPASLREALSNFSPAQIRGNQTFSDRINGSLGIDPNVLKEYATTLPLVQARIGAVVDAIRVKFAVTLLPLVEKVLGAASDYLAANADKVAETISRVGQVLVFQLPIILLKFVANVAGGLSRFLEALSLFTRALMAEIPALFAFAGEFVKAIKTVGSAVSAVASTILKIMSGLGIIPNPGGGDAPTAATQAASMAPSGPRPAPISSGVPWWQTVAKYTVGGAAAGAGIGAVVGGIPTFGIGTGPGALGGAAAGGALGFLGGLSTLFGQWMGNTAGRPGDPRRAATTAAAQAAALNPTAVPVPTPSAVATQLASANNPGSGSSVQNRLQAILGSLASGESNAAGMLANLEKGANGAANSWQSEMLEATKAIKDRATETASNTSKQERSDDLREMAQMMARVSARLGAYIAEDNALNVLRTG